MQEIETKDEIDEEFEEEFGPDTMDGEIEAKFTIDEDDEYDVIFLFFFSFFLFQFSKNHLMIICWDKNFSKRPN